MTSWTVITGDCRERLAELESHSVDACVTDPPYELGFMGKAWDRSGVAFDPETWRAVLRVLKPGGHLLAFGGTRTVHRIACAIEDAGFDIRDQLSWLYGTGFPKSLNIGDGRGTALKPACEPIVMARRPLIGTVAVNVLAHGTGAINIDACRIEGAARPLREHAPQSEAVQGSAYAPTTGALAVGETTTGRWPANVLLDEDAAAMLDAQAGERKSGSMRAGTYAGRHGDVYSPDAGRPLAQDIVGSKGGASRFFYVAKASRKERDAGLQHLPTRTGGEATDREDGSAGLNSPRAGAGRRGGARNHHPTVKPVQLMRYLVQLVTPKGGVVLDPFMGSGTTGVAAVAEGLRFIGIERESEYAAIAEARIVAAQAQTSLYVEDLHVETSAEERRNG